MNYFGGKDKFYNANEESYIQYKVTKIVTFKIFNRFKIKLGYYIDTVDKEREKEREMIILTFLFNTKSQLFRVPFLRERETERERETCLYKFSLKIFKFCGDRERKKLIVICVQFSKSAV